MSDGQIRNDAKFSREICWKYPLGRWSRWVNNIIVDYKEIGCEDQKWSELAHGGLVLGFGIGYVGLSGDGITVLLGQLDGYFLSLLLNFQVLLPES